MIDPPQDKELSEISTCWADLHLAHADARSEETKRAQERLLRTYKPAILRYLTAALHDPEAAQDLFQIFSVRFLAGGFRHADPDRGRFRDYLKSALFNLVRDHRRRTARMPGPLSSDVIDPRDEAPPSAHEDEAFLLCCRDALLGRAFRGLQAIEHPVSRPWAAILKLRMQNEGWTAAQIAADFSARTGRRYSEDWARKCLMTARMKFSEILLREVAQTISDRSLPAVEEELIELRLHSWLRKEIRRRRDVHHSQSAGLDHDAGPRTSGVEPPRAEGLRPV